ncbi:MAG: hypothetical protein MK165_14785 [Pirellulaceae bacterium]|nr:hypothetical protein [Pirellulaceae bacterium]
MKMPWTITITIFLTTFGTMVAANEPLPFGNVQCDGDYEHHLQGVCTNRLDAIYWSFTTQLVKTDRRGHVLKQVPVVNHHGDLCFYQEHIYVAVNLGNFNDPAGNADSWVYVYEAKTLNLIAKHETQEVFHGAGGIDVAHDRFYIVGGLPEGVKENYVYEYNRQFEFQRKHTIRSGWTRLGIQTATFHDEAWWFGCYGTPAVLLKTDADFKLLGRHSFDCSLGLAGIGKDRFLVAEGPRTADERCLGLLHLASPDSEHGLTLLPNPTDKIDLPSKK